MSTDGFSARPTTIITFGGAKFIQGDVKETKEVNGDGEKKYQVIFNNGMTVTYPEQPEGRNASLLVNYDTLEDHSTCDQVNINRFFGLELTGSQDRSLSITSKGTVECKYDLSINGDWDAVYFKDDEKSESLGNSVKLDNSDYLYEKDGYGVDGPGVHTEGEHPEDLL